MKLVSALALLLAAPLYLPRLMRSFWVDETCTYWMAYEGISVAIEKCSRWPGQSILYGALAAPFCLDVEGPWREPLLRFPSLIGIALMIFFTSRLATRAMGATAGWCTAILILFHPASLDLFSLARPYGLAAAAVAASYYFLYEWVEIRERRYLAGYAVATALIFYLHYLFVVALAGHAVYLAWVLLFEKRTSHWRDLALSIGVIGLLLMPLVPHMLLLFRESHTLPVAPRPSWGNLRFMLLPRSSVLGAAAALVLMVVLGRVRQKWKLPSPGFLALLLGWWTAGTLALFVISRLSTHQVFIPRYLGSSLPGESLVLAVIGATLIPPRWAVGWALLFALATTGDPRQWRELWKLGPDEARPAIEIVRQISPSQPPPLFYQSGLAESNFLDWQRGPEATYLFNELVAYPVPNRVYPLPIRFTDEVKPYFSGLMEGELQSSPVILLICQGNVPEWIATHMQVRGYRMELSRPNVYTVALFRK